MVGKYVGLPDAYKSLNEALIHGGIANRVKVNIRWLDAELFEHDDSDSPPMLEPMHGILVPGGFGERGSEGKIASVRFARERDVPFFGICLGMQMACIEGARNPPASPTPSTTEFGATDEPVVGIITEWMSAEGLQKREAGGDLGGTMRLGAYEAKLPATAASPASMAAPTGSANATATATRSTAPTGRAGKGRADLFGHVPGRLAARDRRAARPSVVRRRPVPSRTEVQAVRPASVVRELHRGGGEAVAAGLDPPLLLQGRGTIRLWRMVERQ